MTRIMSTSATALMAVVMSAGMAVGQQAAGQGQAGQGEGAAEAEHSTFEDRMDLNKDVETDIGTFSENVDRWGVYDAWDVDRDEALTRDEFNRGLFTMYDRDRDEILGEDEVVGMQNEQFFGDAGPNIGANDDIGTFSQNVDQAGIYDAWDVNRDEALTRDEFSRGLFATYDRDRDEMLGEDEIVGMQNERLFGGEGVRTLGADDDRIE